MTYTIIGLLVLAGLFFYLKNRSASASPEANTATPQTTQDTTTLGNRDTAYNPYEDLRLMALSATPEQLGLQLPSGETTVYGVVMDWGLAEGTATLVAFETGEASLYLSSGGGVIGGVGHETVQQAAKAFVQSAAAYLSRAGLQGTAQTTATPLPGKDNVQFYFLTNKGKFVANEAFSNIEHNSSPLLNLFEAGNTVITEIRTVGDIK